MSHFKYSIALLWTNSAASIPEILLNILVAATRAKKTKNKQKFKNLKNYKVKQLIQCQCYILFHQLACSVSDYCTKS